VQTRTKPKSLSIRRGAIEQEKGMLKKANCKKSTGECALTRKYGEERNGRLFRGQVWFLKMARLERSGKGG